MHAALTFGRRGLGRTAPNPSVGALLVKDGVIISRGVTAPGGRPHAETQALDAAGERARGATLYVTLEPCSHYGHTKPCADAIVTAGVARVVIACGDPDPRVAGRGIERLRTAGIAVITGILADQARRDHAGHIRRVVDRRPFITLKIAETADGFAASPSGDPRLLITGAMANAWVQGQRALHDAVLVGAGTARADDPRLDVRLPGMEADQPVRVVFDPAASTPLTGRLVMSAARSPVVVVAGPHAASARVEALRAAGVHVVSSLLDQDGRLDLAAALRHLAGGLTRVFCEGGPRLGAALLVAGYADEVAVLTGPVAFGRAGLAAFDPAGRTILNDRERYRLVEDKMLGPDRLRRFEKVERCSQA
ncbi:bifunctional diaminohydroxyphosphoribosylaminopyrimidine deaminase/5-amino-6-(5-phosphoribosylamino)uracil reductase RibD [Lichenihabitans psoromatis]|uniref:bifunctional diaminohydroxyphosphoribosylaminopyrimidine deaminase/5-amino-6-(5-phosphoribosylamino)uracil reductase RibD n=1 Tax=Lichenihabitans psoromatis TaxID=2528642 RepID=UPI001036956F|nr:bifunctional diaminohydroxyphosphoribosylaminopyrimidine deaminase/5-amino-6-(5-phosphoribosylamino)uracil reductase RibD [Lichenihabitans psoromatis]